MSAFYFSGASHSNSSTSLQTGSLVFGGSKEGMHQRSFSVSSADQWNEAINTSTSSGARKTCTRYQNLSYFKILNSWKRKGCDPRGCGCQTNKGLIFLMRRLWLLWPLWLQLAGRSSVFREKEEWRLTCCSVSQLVTHCTWLKCDNMFARHVYTYPPPILSLPSVVPPCAPPHLFSSLFSRRGKWMLFGDTIYHQLFPSLCGWQ